MLPDLPQFHLTETHPFTPAQAKILMEILNGTTEAAAIANKLGISKRTIDAQLQGNQGLVPGILGKIEIITGHRPQKHGLPLTLLVNDWATLE